MHFKSRSTMFIKWLLPSLTEHLPLLLHPSRSHPHSPLLNITVWNFPYRGKFFLIICYFGHTNNYNTLHLHFITIISNYWLLNGKLGFALTAGKAYFTKPRSNNTFKIYRFGIFYNVKSFLFWTFRRIQSIVCETTTTTTTYYKITTTTKLEYFLLFFV